MKQRIRNVHSRSPEAEGLFRRIIQLAGSGMRVHALRQLCKLAVIASVLSACVTVAQAASPQPLKGEELETLVPGTHIELDTPISSVVPVQFGENKLMTGQAHALASFLGSEKDRGRWRIDGDKLCLKWFRWFDAEERCLSIVRDGSRIYWNDGDGETGTGTITNYGSKYRMANARTIGLSLGGPQAGGSSDKSSGDAPKAAEQAKPAAPEMVRAGTVVAAAPPPEPPKPAVSSSIRAEPVKPRPVARQTRRTAQDVPERYPPPRRNVARLEKKTGASAMPPPKRPTDKKTVRRELPSGVSRRGLLPSPTYQVARVRFDDVLNIRNGPSEYHDAIGAIPPAGKGVRIVGPCQNFWCPIVYRSKRGWVNRYYLAKEGSLIR